MTAITQPGTLLIVDAKGSQQIANTEVNLTTGNYSPHVVIEVNGVAAGSGNPLIVQDVTAEASLATIATNTTPVALTPVAPTGSLTLTTGATAQVLTAAGTATHGGMILNPASATQQNVGTAESVWVCYTGATAVMQAGAQSFEIAPGGVLELPVGLATGISWIAATAGHRITAEVR